MRLNTHFMLDDVYAIKMLHVTTDPATHKTLSVSDHLSNNEGKKTDIKFAIVDVRTGLTPSICRETYDTPQDAVADYMAKQAELSALMPVPPEINNIITLSTAHISEETAERLKNDPNDNNLGGFTVYEKGEFGWFVYLPDRKFVNPKNMPEDLMACAQLVRSQDCSIICFDCDALPLSALPVYDW